MSLHFLPHQVGKAVLLFLEDLATPTSLKVKILIEHGEWDQLSSLRLDPGHYLDSESYWRDASAIEILRKYPELPTTFDKKSIAEETFETCEKMCLRANRRLYPYLSSGVYSDENKDVSAVFRLARKIIAEILGPCPLQGWRGRHGPGSTFGDKGNLCTVPDKMSSNPSLTPDSWPILFEWVGTAWASACSVSGKNPTFVPGNRFTTVPKDSSKNRGIAIEPSLNIFYQLGLGQVIRDRLRRCGINLVDGQDIHRRVACEASKDGYLATMDLSNASDTICRNLVKLLLPRPWFSTLDLLRSKKTLFRGKWVLLEKFSSMGNGFTFELETVIFLGLVMSVGASLGHNLKPGKDVFAYGDDLIFPSAYSKAVISLMSFSGLSVNRRKTFDSGPFRESCGGDFFNGVNVRPHFLKESPNEPQQLIALANGLSRSSQDFPARSRSIRRAWFRVLDSIPSPIRNCRGPKALGDLCVHDDESRWRLRHRHDIRYVQVYRPSKFRKVLWENFKPDVVLASALLGVPSGARLIRPSPDPDTWYYTAGGVIPRDAVSGYKIGWVAFS